MKGVCCEIVQKDNVNVNYHCDVIAIQKNSIKSCHTSAFGSTFAGDKK